MMNIFGQSCNKYLLRMYFVPGIVLLCQEPKHTKIPTLESIISQHRKIEYKLNTMKINLSYIIMIY